MNVLRKFRRPRAGERLSVLYRYRPFVATRDLVPEAKGYLCDFLRRRRLWIPHAASLNDPWEFSPAYVHSLWKRDRELEIAEHLEFLNPTRSREEFAAVLAQIRVLGADAVRERCRQQLFNGFRTHGVVSFSERADIFLMWSYYSHGHNGYALAFNAKALPFRESMRVSYSRRHPRISLSARSTIGLADEVFAKKAREWRHEREWRLVVVPDRALDTQGFESFERPGAAEGYYGRVSADSLAGLVLGDRLFNGKHAAPVLDLVRRYRSSLPVWHAKIDKHRFRVHLERVSL